jgi:hypothetical protein
VSGSHWFAFGMGVFVGVILGGGAGLWWVMDKVWGKPEKRLSGRSL